MKYSPSHRFRLTTLKVKSTKFVGRKSCSTETWQNCAVNTFGLTCTFATIALRDLYKYLGDGDEEKLDFAKFYQGFIEKRDIVEKNLNKIVW